MVHRNRTRISSFGLAVPIFELELSCQEGALTQVITARCPYRHTLHHRRRHLRLSSFPSTSRGTWKGRWRTTIRPFTASARASLTTRLLGWDPRRLGHWVTGCVERRGPVLRGHGREADGQWDGYEAHGCEVHTELEANEWEKPCERGNG